MTARVIQTLLLAQLLFGFVYVRYALAQTQDALNERYQAQILHQGDQIRALEAIAADARLRVLEASMFEVTWMGRCVAGAVVGQLALAVFGRRRRFPPDDEE